MIQELSAEMQTLQNQIDQLQRTLVLRAQTPSAPKVQQATSPGPVQKAATEDAANPLLVQLAGMLQMATPKASQDTVQDLDKIQVSKLGIPIFDRSSPDKVKNSQYLLNSVLENNGLLAVAYGGQPATPSEQRLLRRIVNEWVKADESVVTDLRTAFGDTGGPGVDMYARVLEVFVTPLCKDLSNPETELLEFKWQNVCNKDGAQTLSMLNKLWSIVSRLPAGRGGTPEYWLEEITMRIPPMLLSQFDKEVRKIKDPVAKAATATDRVKFGTTLAAAVNAMNRKSGPTEVCRSAAWKEELEKWFPAQEGGSESCASFKSMNVPGAAGSDAEKKQFTPGRPMPCGKCKLPWCKKGRWPDARCDGYDPLSPERIAKIKQFSDGYYEQVQKKRAEVGATPLDEQPAVKTHAASMHGPQSMERTIDEVEALLNKYSPAFNDDELGADCDDQEE